MNSRNDANQTQGVSNNSDENQEQQEQQQKRKNSWWAAFKEFRKLAHAVKVGAALSLSSLFMLVEEPPRLLGENAIWAIMTVVVVFEYTVGATLSKGLNRGLGTLAAAFVGLGVSHLADLLGSNIGEAAVIISSVFLTSAVATFVRFIPKVKAKFDYGVLIFILTFSLISVSSYQNEDSFKTASTRMFTILVGCGISLVICMFVLPNWAGEDLHALISCNFETLAQCLQGTVDEYLQSPETTMQAVMEKEAENRADDDEISKKYRGLLSCSQTEESLVKEQVLKLAMDSDLLCLQANFAGWEPPHGKFFRFGYPWKHYVKAPYELRQVFRTEILKVTSDAVDLLKQLGSNIRRMQKSERPVELLMELTGSTELLQEFIDSHSHMFINPGMVIKPPPLANNPSFEYANNDVDSLPASPHDPQQQPQDLRTMHRMVTLGSYTSLSMRSIRSASNFSVATFTSLLIETVARLENLVDVVDCLSELARFKPEASAEDNPRKDPNSVTAARSDDQLRKPEASCHCWSSFVEVIHRCKASQAAQFFDPGAILTLLYYFSTTILQHFIHSSSDSLGAVAG